MSPLESIKHGFFIGIGLASALSIAYAAISWPSTPAGETTGGKYSLKLVPSGAIMAFNLATCPAGWSAADGTNSTPDLRGVFVRGIGGDANGRDSARTLADYQTDAFQGHALQFTDNANTMGWNYLRTGTFTWNDGASKLALPGGTLSSQKMVTDGIN